MINITLVQRSRFTSLSSILLTCGFILVESANVTQFGKLFGIVLQSGLSFVTFFPTQFRLFEVFSKLSASSKSRDIKVKQKHSIVTLVLAYDHDLSSLIPIYDIKLSPPMTYISCNSNPENVVSNRTLSSQLIVYFLLVVFLLENLMQL